MKGQGQLIQLLYVVLLFLFVIVLLRALGVRI